MAKKKGRRVDSLGRVVIPSDMRENHGMVEGAKILFEDHPRGVLIVRDEDQCIFCNTVGYLHECEGRMICLECVQRIVFHYSE